MPMSTNLDILDEDDALSDVISLPDDNRIGIEAQIDGVKRSETGALTVRTSQFKCINLYSKFYFTSLLAYLEPGISSSEITQFTFSYEIKV